VTGRGDIGSHNNAIAQAYLKLGRVMGFAPRFRVSRMQMLLLPANPQFWHMPPEARRIVYKNWARWFGMHAAIQGLLYALGWITLGALAGSLDPDDDDFLKIKIGKFRFDLTGGIQPVARFLWKLLLSGKEGVMGEVPLKMAGWESLKSSLNFLRSGADPRASLAIDRVMGSDYTGKPFTWFGDYGIDGALGSRLTPMTASQFAETAKAEGLTDALIQSPFEFFGVNSAVYPDRPDEPKTKAEKLARRYVSWNFSGAGKNYDEATKRQLDDLKTRSRAGEDVTGEVSRLVDAGKITEDKGDSIINARNSTPLQDKVRQLPLKNDEGTDATHLLEYMTADEKQSVESIMHKKELIQAAKAAKERKQAEEEEKFERRREKVRATNPAQADKMLSPEERRKRTSARAARTKVRNLERKYGNSLGIMPRNSQ
jgi:hypothetical protein